MRGLAALLVALALGGGLVAWYIGAGALDYRPLASRDPCATRPWRSPEGIDAIAQQVALSALDGAACQLDVPRETLALALTSDSGRERFMRENRISRGELEGAIRSGLRRAVADAKEAGAISGFTAFLAERAVELVPADRVLDAINERSLDPLIG